MKKIVTLSIQVLKDKLYVAYMLFVLEAINKSEVIKEKFEYYVEQFKKAFGELDDIYLKYDRLFCTKEVQVADEGRDIAYRRLREKIRYISIFAAEKEKQSAAERLLEVTNLYGGSGVVNQGINAKTATLFNMIEDFEKKFSTEIELLGLAEQLAELKAAQKKFDEVYMSRTEAVSEKGKDAMTEARRKMDGAYRDLVTMINMGAKRDSEGILTSFINIVNVEIGKYRVYTGQGQVGSSGSGTDTDEDGEEVLPMKTVTFKFANDTVQKYKALVGSPLTAPLNTAGYCWSPMVPAFIPEKNTTYKEVPIKLEESTATFHFADHTEEELRQPVGSILTPPASTEGYEWVPKVPAMMPAEDTTYYDMPLDDVESEETTESSLADDEGIDE